MPVSPYAHIHNFVILVSDTSSYTHITVSLTNNIKQWSSDYLLISICVQTFQKNYQLCSMMIIDVYNDLCMSVHFDTNWFNSCVMEIVICITRTSFYQHIGKNQGLDFDVAELNFHWSFSCFSGEKSRLGDYSSSWVSIYPELRWNFNWHWKGKKIRGTSWISGQLHDSGSQTCRNLSQILVCCFFFNVEDLDGP